MEIEDFHRKRWGYTSKLNIPNLVKQGFSWDAFEIIGQDSQLRNTIE